jgi:hypothetical protein
LAPDHIICDRVSKANGKSYSIGDFELASFETLRARVAGGAGGEGSDRNHSNCILSGT